MDMEKDILNLIAHSGEARSLSLEAIKYAKNREFKKSENNLSKADKKLIKVHNIQTSLLQREASGEEFSISILLIHAQDHLMNAITIHTLAREFIDIFKKLNNIDRKEECCR